MSQEQVYSLEKKIILDAELAYDFYWDKQIFDKSKFKCPTENCQARFTCANMDVQERDLKQIPHFRKHPSTTHDKLCPFHEDNIVSLVYKNGNSKYKNKVKSNFEIFNFHRPPSHFKDYDKTSENKEKKFKSKSDGSDTSSSYNQKRYYTLRSVVNRYIKYREMKKLEEQTIYIKEEYTYKNLFKGIYNQNFLNISKEHIFWQKAWVNRTKKDDAYMINFVEALDYNEKKLRPSIYISDKVIEKSFNKNLLKMKLQNSVGKKSPEVVVFIYGKPQYNTYNGGSISFFLENLDLLEIRLAKDFYDNL